MTRTLRVPSRHAFTLIELIVVIVILGVLAALAVPNFASVQRKSSVETLLKSAAAFDRNIRAQAAADQADPRAADLNRDGVQDSTSTPTADSYVGIALAELPANSVTVTVQDNSTADLRFDAVLFTDRRGNRVRLVIASTSGSAGTIATYNPTYSDTVLADAPQLYLRLNDRPTPTAVGFGDLSPDSSGYNRTYEYTGGTAGYPSLIGETGDTSWYHAGTNYMRQASLPALPASTAPFTVEIWGRLSHACSSAKWAMQISNEFTIGVDATCRPELRVLRADGTVLSLVATTAIAVDTTHHLVGRSDGTTVTLLVDGVVAATAPIGSPRATTTNAYLYIGHHSSPTYWTGQLDEPAYYTTALSDARIAEHYRIGTGG